MELKLPRDGIVEFEVEWQRARQFSVPGFGLLDTDGDGVAETLPPPIDPRINLNNQPWSLPFESRNVVGTLRYEQAIGAAWSIGLRGLAQRILTNDRIAFPDGCSSGPNYVYPGMCGNYDTDIYDFRSDGERRTTRASEAYAITRFDTGAIAHRVRLGARATRYAERLPPLQAYNFVGTTNVFAPVDLPADPSLTVLNAQRDLALDEAYLYDAMKFGAAWSLSLGARYVHVENRSALSDGSESAAFERDLVTPWAAIGWQPWRDGYFYLSSGTGVEAEVVPNRPADFANPGQALPVGRSRQIELGYKQGFENGGDVSVAVFQIRKPYSGDVAQPGGPPLRVADGRIAQHRGAEIGLTRFVTRQLALSLRATYLDATIHESIDPELAGKRVTNVPKFAASLGANLRPTDAADLQWRNVVGYVGTKAATMDNSVVLPSSWQWDTLFVWSPATTSPRLQLRAGVDNVTDRRYWREAPTQPWGATYLFPAQPRTYRVGMTAQW
jgi:iron complex outermembrane receptor protein